MTDKTIDPRFKALAKPFEQGAYKDVKLGRTFTTIDAYHVIERLTQVFGLCGQGWGSEVVDWRQNGDNVAAIGFLWYRGEKTDDFFKVFAVGDAQVMKGNIAEAYKKAQTNLISKAASFLGVGLSVYQGKGIDDPYLDREAMEHGGGNGNGNAAGRPAQRRTPDGPGQALDPDAPSGRVATPEDWQAIQQACGRAGIAKPDLRAMLAEGPFCCGDRPTDLLAVHVPTLLDRIAGLQTIPNGGGVSFRSGSEAVDLLAGVAN
jgi:hypothetical protein